MSARTMERAGLRASACACADELGKAGICGFDVAEARGDVVKCSSGEAFRSLMAKELPERVAVVGGSIDDVDPLNLIAAIKKDCPDRKVFSLSSDWGLSLSDNAARVGVDGSMDGATLKARFGIALPGEETSGRAVPDPAAANSLQAGAIAEDEEGLGACVCVASGRGGAGKSTVCVMLALSAVAHGVSCAVVDADLQFGDLGFLCERDGMFTTMGFGMGMRVPDLSGIEPGTVPVLYSMEKPEYSEELAYGMRQLLVECRRAFDLVVVNTSTSWSDLHADLVGWCDAIVLVASQNTTSVRGGRSAKDLCLRLGAPSSKMFYVVNCYSRSGRIGIHDFAASLSVDPESILTLADGGEQIEEALSLGIPSSLLESGNPIVESSNLAFERIAAKLGLQLREGASQAERPSKKWLFGRKAGGYVAAG